MLRRGLITPFRRDGQRDFADRFREARADSDPTAATRAAQTLKGVAGNIGGLVAILLLWSAVPADSWGRAALRSGVIASVIFAALIEWPVIRRVREGADPFTELAKIPQSLKRNFTIALLSGILMTLVFAP